MWRACTPVQGTSTTAAPRATPAMHLNYQTCHLFEIDKRPSKHNLWRLHLCSSFFSRAFGEHDSPDDFAFKEEASSFNEKKRKRKNYLAMDYGCGDVDWWQSFPFGDCSNIELETVPIKPLYAIS